MNPPHVHISALQGFITILYVIVGLGIAHILARRFEGHPLADAVLDFLC